MNKLVLVRSIEIISCLLAAFNGFITNVAPPTKQYAAFSFEVGLISVAALGILLAVIAMRNGIRRYKKLSLAICLLLLVAGISVALWYKSELGKFVIKYPERSDNILITGNSYTEQAAAYLRINRGITTHRLIEDFGGINYITRVWPASSINGVETRLSVLYSVFVLLLLTPILVLSESFVYEKKNTDDKS